MFIASSNIDDSHRDSVLFASAIDISVKIESPSTSANIAKMSHSIQFHQFSCHKISLKHQRGFVVVILQQIRFGLGGNDLKVVPIDFSG